MRRDVLAFVYRDMAEIERQNGSVSGRGRHWRSFTGI
jgi:hypothetical protein